MGFEALHGEVVCGFTMCVSTCQVDYVLIVVVFKLFTTITTPLHIIFDPLNNNMIMMTQQAKCTRLAFNLIPYNPYRQTHSATRLKYPTLYRWTQ